MRNPNSSDADEMLRAASTAPEILSAIINALGKPQYASATIDEIIGHMPRYSMDTFRLYLHGFTWDTSDVNDPRNNPTEWDEIAYNRLHWLIAQHDYDFPLHWERLDEPPDLNSPEGITISTFSNTPFMTTSAILKVEGKRVEPDKQRSAPPDLAESWLTFKEIDIKDLFAQADGKRYEPNDAENAAIKTLTDAGYDNHGFKILNPDTIAPRHHASSALMSILTARRNGIPELGEQAPGVVTAFERVHNLWKQVDHDHPGKYKHPLAPIVERCLIVPIDSATANVIAGFAPLPKTISKVNGTRWRKYGTVDSTIVDGEPIASRLPDLGRTFNLQENRHKKLYIYTPVGTEGVTQLAFNMDLVHPRLPYDIPVPLIAYSEYGYDLRSTLAQDTAHLLTLIYISNQSLSLLPEQGAQLLAQHEDGTPRHRKISKTDIQRFENAYAAISLICAWVKCSDGIFRLYELTACERLSRETNEVRIGAPRWWNRQDGNWTLSAAFSASAKARLVGKSHNNTLWRAITGVETYLTHSQFSLRGKHHGIAKLLIPDSGKNTGAGAWIDKDWRELLIITGDSWNFDDPTQDKKARKRWERLKESIKNAGYVIPNPRHSSTAGDSVEFLFATRGRVKFRATQRFTEAARLARDRDWNTVALTEYLGLKE